MRPITFLCIAVLLAAMLLPHVRAQTADWTVISTPRIVAAGNHLAVAITTPAGATGDVLIVLRAGLRLLSATTSSGVFADSHWQLTGAPEPATLLLLANVEQAAQTDADVTVTATWNGVAQQTRTALIGQSLPPATPIPPGCLFVPLVQYATD